MTEREKRDAGALYNVSTDRELLEESLACKDACQKFNALRPSERAKRKKILQGLLGSCGKDIIIESPFWCDYGNNISVGEHFYMNHGCVILDAASVTIGTHVCIGPNCGIYTSGHPVDVGRRRQGLEYAWPITIGDDVWIGGSVQILPGVKIGSNVVIGFGEEVENVLKPSVYAFGLATIGEHSVIPNNVKIGKNTAISGVTTLADYENGILPGGQVIEAKEGDDL